MLAAWSTHKRSHPFRTTTIEDLYSDARAHGYDGPSRLVRIPRVASPGGAALATSDDGSRCVLAGRESLRILRFSDPSTSQPSSDHKCAVGKGGHRIDASRNLWENSGLKIDSASTDVGWGHGTFSNKILTSARNGELIMWDLNKSGSTKYERRTKDHTRSIHTLALSHTVQHYCITGSAEGEMRVWDLRDMSKSIMRIRFPTSVRSLAFSPSQSQPVHAMVGLENGTIYRWDLQNGQRGQLDRLAVAHNGSVTSLDWSNHIALPPPGSTAPIDTAANSHGWLLSGGLDNVVKVWDLTDVTASSHMPHKPIYTLHPSFPVRRALWRPSYPCEVVVVSNAKLATGVNTELETSGIKQPLQSLSAARSTAVADTGDAVEIWDVRRAWLPKWSVTGSAIEGGVTDLAFRDPHALWAAHASGSFSQLDLRSCTKPIDAISRVSTTWNVQDSLTLISDLPPECEIPYDDVREDARQVAEERKWKLKALGDKPDTPRSQDVATFQDSLAPIALEAFTLLAKRYVCSGVTPSAICTQNAEAAFEAGKSEVAHVWLLMSTLLTDTIPQTLSPFAFDTHLQLPSSASAPVAPTNYSFPTPLMSPSGLFGMHPADSAPAVMQRGSTSVKAPSIHSQVHDSPLWKSSTPRRLTPTSSTSNSPRQILSPLPQQPPVQTPRPPSFYGRRESIDHQNNNMALTLGSTKSLRKPSIFRRPSSSIHSGGGSGPHGSASPGERSASASLSSSSRHVSEAALDDSDSSEDERDKESLTSWPTIPEEEDGKEHGDRYPNNLLLSPLLAPLRYPAQPSPLSKPWNDDDVDVESASPQSTDSDSEGGGAGTNTGSRRSSRKATNRRRPKMRSRSSTVASLAAPSPIPRNTNLKQQQSQQQQQQQLGSPSSIKTVVLAETSFQSQEKDFRALEGEDTIKDLTSLNGLNGFNGTVGPSMERIRSYTNLQSSRPLKAPPASETSRHTMGRRRVSSSKVEEVKRHLATDDEKIIRELGWVSLGQSLEKFAEEGDMQTCAMLAIVAASEFKLSKLRVTRFLDAYLDMLFRLRLHVPSAYLRKFSGVETAAAPTKLETTIYTCCSTCRKPILNAAGNPFQPPIGGFGFCQKCKKATVRCAICRLPVLTLLFQCPVCGHGGHEDCYKKYYLSSPLVEIPERAVSSQQQRASPGKTVGRRSPLVDHHRASPRNGDSIEFPQTSSPSRLAGHACPSGCGHYCSVASILHT